MKRTILAVVCTSVLTALIMGQGKNPVPKVIKAERFELVDAAGEVRAVLGVRHNGDAEFTLFGGEGVLVVLPAGREKANIWVTSGRHQASVFAVPQSAGLSSQNHDFVVQMLVRPDTASVQVSDAKFESFASLVSAKEGATIWIDGPGSPQRIVADSK